MADVKVVVFDTSALILSALEGIDAVESVKGLLNSLIIPTVTVSVIRELWRIAKQGGLRGRAALSALRQIYGRYSIAMLDGEADEDTLRLALREGGLLVTCDMELKRRAESMGVPVVYFRESSRRFEADEQ